MFEGRSFSSGDLTLATTNLLCVRRIACDVKFGGFLHHPNVRNGQRSASWSISYITFAILRRLRTLVLAAALEHWISMCVIRPGNYVYYQVLVRKKIPMQRGQGTQAASIEEVSQTITKSEITGIRGQT